MKQALRRGLRKCKTCQKLIDREAFSRFDGRCESCIQLAKQRKSQTGWYEQMQSEVHNDFLMRIQNARIRPADKQVLLETVKPDEYRTWYCARCGLVRLDSKTLERYGKTPEDIERFVTRPCRRCGRRGHIRAREEHLYEVSFDAITPATFFEPLTAALTPLLLEWGCFQWGYTTFAPEEAHEMIDHHKYRFMQHLSDGCSVLVGNGLLISMTRERKQMMVSGPADIVTDFRRRWVKAGGGGHWKRQ